ncbi:prenyltransferase/squalene oxidase repeat-containing protein [Streptomyces sp. NPDC003444]
MTLDTFRTTDGGARQGGADLWCTYAAVRTLTWLGRAPADPAATARALLDCRNADGGFAWQKGLPSDVWATYYCTQALRDLGAEIPEQDELAAWLTATQHGSGGFAMTEGQRPDVWATYYATRTFREVLARPVPGAAELRDWLGALQRPEGGLGWYPGSAESDVRACYYGAMAWRAAFSRERTPWREPDLVDWLGARQTDRGGFVFDEHAEEPCLWATFRAVRALDALGAKPARAEDCARWITARQLPGTGFTRWDAYPDPDVWAAFSAVGALQTLGGDVPDAAAVETFLHDCELPQGGFTYRGAEGAGDSLATASLLLVRSAGDDVPSPADQEAQWLRAAHLPYEGGVMYMPGRGAEIRCTLWAVSALATTGSRGPDDAADGLDADRLTEWLRRLQNRDGGFGYWHGRASDMVATVSALEILRQLDRPAEVLDTAALRAFLDACRDGSGHRHVPEGRVTCASTAQAARALHLIGEREAARERLEALAPYASRLGGYAATPRGVPDLVSTYQAVLTRQTLGAPPRADDDVPRFLDKVRVGTDLYAWSPLGRRPAGPLAAALGTLLHRAPALPPLNL